MKILIAPDKFKGSLSALEACEALRRGMLRSNNSLEITLHPMADGGDGSLESISNHLALKEHLVDTIDPLGRPITASYFTSSGTAFIELASASGLVLLTEKERNPLLTSTLGTGNMLLDAISKGYQTVYLFLGGSATNDAGMGIASALGFRFLDELHRELQPIGENLLKIKEIESTSLFDFEKINITLLCDVNNPLFGPTGAAHVYASQKGATSADIISLDHGLQHFSNIIKKKTGIDVGGLPGSGAAGGIGASLVALCGAQFANGFETIAKLTKLEEHIKSADWVISGEGKLDAQSLQGKVIFGIAELCKKHQKSLTLFVGKNELAENDLQTINAEHVFAISDRAENLGIAMSEAATFLEEMGFEFQQFI